MMNICFGVCSWGILKHFKYFSSPLRALPMYLKPFFKPTLYVESGVTRQILQETADASLKLSSGAFFSILCDVLSCKISWSQMSQKNADHTALPCPGWSMDTSKFLYKAGYIPSYPFCPSYQFLIAFKPRPCAWCQILVVLSRSGGQLGLSQVTKSLRSRTELGPALSSFWCSVSCSFRDGRRFVLRWTPQKTQTPLCCQPGKVCSTQTSCAAELLPEGVSLNSPDLASVLCWFISLQCIW